MAYTDQRKLISHCILRKRKAQDALFENYKRMVMGVCIRYAKNDDDVDDIFQESFIKVFQNLKKLREIEALGSWIRKTTVRTAINFNVKYRSKIEEPIEHELYMEDNNHAKILNRLSNEELIKCINSMPDGYREVFNMYVVDGFKHREIADLLMISENTSKSQLRCAKIHLRETLKKMGIVKYERAV